MAANNKSKKVIDVSTPGKAAPSPTSRPIIVNHGPILSDPMMQKDNENKPNETLLPPSQANRVIDRPAEEGKTTKKSATKSDQPEEKPDETVVVKVESSKPEESELIAEPEAEAEAKPEPEAETESAASEPPAPTDSITDEAPLSDDAATVDAVAQTSAADKKKADEELKALEEHKNLVNQLVNERKYYVPLSVARHKRHHRTVLFLLILLAVVVGGVAYAVQAGYLDSLL